MRAFIFVATTGRSGTTTLQRLFATVPNCASVHEPHPVMNGEILRAANEGDDSYVRRQFRLRKLPHIYWRAKLKDWYVETNHLFIHCFAHHAISTLGPRVRVIHLVRNASDVAVSCLTSGSIPGTICGNQWCGDYRAPRNVIKIADLLEHDTRFSTDYFKCLWYWYETEARLAQFRREYPSIPVYDVSTPDLNDHDRISTVLQAIGMDVDHAHLGTVIGTRANVSDTRQCALSKPDFRSVTAFHNICIERMRERCCSLPRASARMAVPSDHALGK